MVRFEDKGILDRGFRTRVPALASLGIREPPRRQQGRAQTKARTRFRPLPRSGGRVQDRRRRHRSMGRSKGLDLPPRCRPRVPPKAHRKEDAPGGRAPNERERRPESARNGLPLERPFTESLRESRIREAERPGRDGQDSRWQEANWPQGWQFESIILKTYLPGQTWAIIESSLTNSNPDGSLQWP